MEQRGSRTANYPRSETKISSKPPPRPQPKPPIVAQMRSRITQSNGSRLKFLDPVELAYLRTSFIFALSVLVTWTPSSISRIHSLINPNDTNWGFSIATSIVLPLQGVWNAVIYFKTSWSKAKEEYHALMASRSARRLYRRGESKRGEARIEVVWGSQRDRFDMAPFRRTQRPSSDEMSELELTAPVNIINDNIRV